MELYYNPERMTETEVKETFVANQWLVDEILSILKQQPKGAGVQHALIIAPRGMGKTTILLMLRFFLLEGELAQSWQPVLFPEESYAVYDLADFWISGLGHIATETGDEELNEKIFELQRIYRTGEELEEAALATIKDWRVENNKRLVMLVDSFDIILTQINSERDHARLRDALMNDGTIMLVGCATTFFKEARDYDQPLYNLFKRYDLQSLTSEQIHELLRRRAKLDGAENFDEQLRRNASRLRVLEYFTGGNPRLVMMLYRVITRSEVSEVRRGLEKLLDEVTPYYKAKIEALPPQQRKILDHIARISARTREGLTPTEIATSVRLGVNQVSSQLKRLADIGYVRAANIRGRSSYYTLSEPLYAIWHQMRFGREARERMNWLVTFLKDWYDAEELSSECDRLQNTFEDYLTAGRFTEASDVLEYRRYLMRALENHDESSNAPNSKQVKATVELGIMAFQKHDRATATRHFEHALEIAPSSPQALLAMVAMHSLLGDIDKARQMIEKAEPNFAADDFNVLYFRAIKSALDGDFEGATAKLEDLDEESAVLMWRSIGITFSLASRFDEALTSFSNARTLEPLDSEIWYELAYTLRDLNRTQEALQTVERSLELKPDSPNALYLRGFLLNTLGKLDDALLCVDQALELDPEATRTWLLRGATLVKLQKLEEGLQSFAKACELEPHYYDALVCRGALLATLNRTEEAIDILADALRVEPTSFDARYLRGFLLSTTSMDAEAIEELKHAFSSRSNTHRTAWNTSNAHSAKFILSLLDRDFTEAGNDWQRLRECAEAEGGQELWRHTASSALIRGARKHNWTFVRNLISTSNLEEPLFPLARALDYMITGDTTLIEKLSPEVRKIVEEIVDTLKKSAAEDMPKIKLRKPKAKKA